MLDSTSGAGRRPVSAHTRRACLRGPRLLRAARLRTRGWQYPRVPQIRPPAYECRTWIRGGAGERALMRYTGSVGMRVSSGERRHS
eukprot:651974-Pleurochrysis_carterae.AAC.1